MEARITGGLEREIRVTYEPERLAIYNLTVTQLMNTVISNNVNTPGGDVDVGIGNYLVKIPGEFESPQEASSLIVTADTAYPIFLTDVASMEDGFEDVKSRARFNGHEAVSVDVVKRSGINLLTISEHVKAIIEAYRDFLPDGVEISIVNDQSTDVRTMVSDLENSILSGLVLVLVVVFFSLGIRNALLVACAIPLSMLIAFFALSILGITLNMVVLFSLVLAVGMLVDNAIVIIENIYRQHAEGKPKFQAALDATHEVMWPVIASSATTIAAFSPLIFWPGVVGEFMSFLPKTVIVVLSASLFVALVVNPALASIFVKIKPGHAEREAKKPHPVLHFYEKVLRGAIHHPFYTIAWAFSLLIVVFIAYAKFGHGVSFFPDVDPPRAYVDIKMPKGSSLETTDRIVLQVEAAAMEHENVRSVVTSVGAITTGIEAMLTGGGGGSSPDQGRVMLEFIDMEDRKIPVKATLQKLREQLAHIYEADIEITEEEGGPPTGAPVNIEISGDDYAVLEQLMRIIKDRILGIPGLVDVRDDYVVARPEIVVDVDKERAALLGLSANAVGYNVKAAVRGIEAGKFRDGKDEYDILVRLPQERRQDMDTLRNLMIARPQGGFVPLSSVAELRISAGLGTIVHSDRKRVITIEGSVEGRLATEVLADVQMALADLQLPRGYQIAYRGESEDREEAEGFLASAFIGALLLIALILVTEFNSVYKPLIVLSSVILSTMGVFMGLMITQQPFDIIMSGLGVISLAGVVVNNAIVLLDYAGQLRDRGLENVESLVKAGITRFRPVLLTAITTILGLMPMAVGVSFDFRQGGWQVGTESAQWWGPMATSVIFGLAVATVLTLLVAPAMVSAGDIILERYAQLRRRFGAAEAANTAETDPLSVS